MALTTFNAPLAIIKADNVSIGFVQNLTVNENTERSPVRGIGNLTPREVPAVGWTGTVTAEQFLVDYYRALNELEGSSLIQRVVESEEQFIDTVLLNDAGIDLDIYRKVEDNRTSTGAINSKIEIFASIRGCFLTRDGMNISDGQVSSRSVEMMFINPVFKLR